MADTIDSFRYLDFLNRKIFANWIEREPKRDIPWTPVAKPLSECTLALVSSAGIALKTDAPFDQEGERRNPWWGDPSHRVVPATAQTDEVDYYHLHVDATPAREDLNCVLPLTHLHQAVASGQLGRVAPSHYSYMGYILEPAELLEKTVPQMIHQMRQEQVDAVLLIPV